MTSIIKRVSDYANLSFHEVRELPYSYFLLLNKESWIYSYMNFDAGRETLKALARLSQTGADVDAIRSWKGGD